MQVHDFLSGDIHVPLAPGSHCLHPDPMEVAAFVPKLVRIPGEPAIRR
jgi:hypothetical protein